METVYCKSCGAPIDADSLFCSKCGKAVDQPTTIVAPVPPMESFKLSKPAPGKKNTLSGCLILLIFGLTIWIVATLANSGHPTDTSSPPAASSPDDQPQVSDSPAVAPTPDPPTTHTIVLKVTGSTDSVDVTYENYQGGTAQDSNMAVPWRYEMNNMPDGTEFYISAQNQESYGNVVVSVYEDGALIKQSKGIGQYSIASADGSI